MKFWNYECRLCHNIISREQNSDWRKYGPPRYLTARAKWHPHCTHISQLQEDEKLILDLVTVSDSPLARAVDIVYQTDIAQAASRNKGN